MSILINIPDLKKPQNCAECPFHFHQEEDHDHYEFYQCIFEHWNESCTKTPMSKEDIKKGVLDSCPIKEYNYDDGFSCRNETIRDLTSSQFCNTDNILYRIALNIAEVADQLAESNGYYMAPSMNS